MTGLEEVARYLGLDAAWWEKGDACGSQGITCHELWGSLGDRWGRLCAFDIAARDSRRAMVLLRERLGTGQVSELEILKRNRRSW